MRRIAFGMFGFVVLSRAVVACGGDDSTNQDASLDAPSDNTTAKDSPVADVVNDVTTTDTGSDGAVDAGGDSTVADASDASDASKLDATLDASSDAPTDALVSDAASCIDGGIACGSGTPCCTNIASVNYGKCTILNLCK